MDSERLSPELAGERLKAFRLRCDHGEAHLGTCRDIAIAALDGHRRLSLVSFNLSVGASTALNGFVASLFLRKDGR